MAGIRSLIIKIGAQTEEIDSALKKLGASVRSTAAEIKAMDQTQLGQATIKSFNDMKATIDGVRQAQERLGERARLTALGIEQLGGSSRLTKSELDAVNRTLEAGVDAYRALGQQAPADLLRVSTAVANQRQELDKLQKSGATGFFKDLQTHILGTAAGFVSAQAVIGGVQTAFRTLTTFVSGSVTAFAEQEAASKKVEGALRASGLAVPSVIASYRELGSEFQKTTVFADDLIETSEALLTQIGNVMPSQMRQALQASADLAAGLGIDLETATRTVAKAAAGHTEALGRYGLTVSDAEIKTKGFSAVLDAVQDRFGGQAQAQLETYAGRIKAAGNAWGEVKEKIGEFLITNELTIAALNAFATAVGKAQSATDTAVPSIAKLWASLGGSPVASAGIALLELYVGALNEAAAAKAKLAATPNPFKADDPMAGIVARANAEWDKFGKEVAKGRKEQEKAKTVAAEHAKEMERFRTSVTDASVEVGLTVFNLNRFNQFTPVATSRADEFREAIDGWIPPLESKAISGFPDKIVRMNDEARRLPASLDQATTATDRFMINLGVAGRVLDGIQTDFAQMGTVAIRAIQEIDAALRNSELSKGQKLGAGLTAALSAGASIAGNTKAGGVLSGAATGAAIGSIIPGVGTAIGAVAGGVAGLIGSLFGDKEKKKLDEMKQSLIDQAGGWSAINESAKDAGTTIKSVLDARTVKDYEKAVKDLNDAIAFQDNAMATLDETTKKYGFTIDELGPAFARQQLDKQAQSLFQDFSVLTSAGINLDTVITRMGGSIQSFINDAIRTGTAVPEAMRPMIQRMIDMGLLTDAAGRKFDTLEGSGITFTESMSQGFTRVVESVEKLTQAIARGLGIALDTVEDKIKKIPPVDIDVRFNVEDIRSDFNLPEIRAASGGLVTAHGIQHFGAGGVVLPFRRKGTDTVPAMLTPGELVLNQGQQEGVRNAIAGGAVAMSTVGNLVSILERQGQAAARDRAEMPHIIARHVRDAVQTARVRRG